MEINELTNHDLLKELENAVENNNEHTQQEIIKEIIKRMETNHPQGKCPTKNKTGQIRTQPNLPHLRILINHYGNDQTNYHQND